MSPLIPIVILVVSFYLALCIAAQYKVNRTLRFTKKQKQLNTALLWLVPLVWAPVVISILSGKANETILQDKESLIRENSHQHLPPSDLE